MKTAVVLLALVAMVASQAQIAEHNPDLVQVVDHNPELVQVVNNNPELVHVVDNNNPSPVHVVDNNNPSPGQWDDQSLHYDVNNFQVDPAFGRPGVPQIDAAFYRPGVNPGDGSELIDKEPAYVDPSQYPNQQRPPYWRGSK